MRALAALPLLLAAASPLLAQDPPRDLTADDYARAERFLAQNTASLVMGASVDPGWLDGNRFWYERTTGGGSEFVVVDPARGTRGPAFDHARLATTLSTASGRTLEASALPLADLAFAPGALIVELADPGARGRFGRGPTTRWRCTLPDYACTRDDAPGSSRAEVLSPDGRRVAFVRDHDLWVRELESGEETRLTDDGQEDFAYATNNAGWTRSERPVLAWSPDSRRIATFQHDARGVGMMYVVRTQVGHPELDGWRYPLPEDSVIFRISRLVVDVEAPEGERVVRFDMPPDPHRSSVCDHVYCGGTFAEVEWSADGTRVAFVSTSRDHRQATLRVADARTGAVRDVLEETVATFFESGYRTWNWRYLFDSDEVLWFSRRDDWSHLYLYDARTGALKRQVTSGDWNVLQVQRVDRAAREVVFVGNEREPGDPYFTYLYRVRIDDGDVRLLTPDSANHTISLSPDGAFFVDTWSTPVVPPTTVVRDRDGRVVMPLEEADVSRLVASGWKPPEPFTVKARDGETDLHGLMFTPLDFDPEKRYPVVNYLYPGPQSGSVGSRSFRASYRDLQAIAELGFVVVELDAMGTPMRSRSFHEAYYGNMGDNGLPDQIGGIRQLAETRPWMDLDRVGIYGHSGGGFAAADAILRYPDFYKVAVSQAGNHDNRNYEDDWGEKWQGLLEEYPDGRTNYDNQANQLLAGNLEGKLLIAHGTMDTNVPPSNTMLVVDALIAANKDFDLLLLPNRGHGFGNEPYMMRRRWDYFVRHLLGVEPPPDYEIGRARRPIG